MMHATAPADQSSVTLHVAGRAWEFSITGVTRAGRDLLISVAVQGPELCTATVHTRNGIVPGITAREILDSTCKWLLTRANERHVYIDPSGQVHPAEGRAEALALALTRQALRRSA